MRIKKLELIGFKSFKDRTVIHFDEGITGVVGPNGCGKSNIVDALVWVMGEMSAKHLRGSSMSDVIFAGSQDYAPLGMCEVSLTLENDGGPFPAKYLRHSEIMITRRLHRSGESEYLINKEQSRLKDIQEVFMDTGAGSKGFSIIEQGAIGKIITAKPQDRRVLIEEAAGITKFKARKKESQRKLKSTEQNLVRLQDIIGEQQKQINSLQRQAQRAERYKKVRDELQEKELWLNAISYKKSLEESQKLAQALDEAQQSETTVSSDISAKESDLELFRVQLLEMEKQLEEKQTLIKANRDEVQQRENQIRELQFEVEQAKRTNQMTGSLSEQYKARQEALVKDKESLQGQFNELQLAAEGFEERLSEKQEQLATILASVKSEDEELIDGRRRFLALSQSLTHYQTQEQSLNAQTEELKERKEQAQSVLEDLTLKRDDFEKRKKKIANDWEKEKQLQLDIVHDVESYQANLEALKADKEKKMVELEGFKDELNEVTSRLYGLEDLDANFEGFQEGVKNVMMWQKQKPEYHSDGSVSFRPVAEVLEVPAEYETAMEAALGPRLQMLLSTSHQESLSAIDYLKSNDSGRSSFIAPGAQDLNQPFADLDKESGFHSRLSDVVKLPENYKKQVAMILDGVIIVDGIQDGIRLYGHYPNHTFVTLDGDVLTKEGVLTGGASKGVDSGVLKRKREIKELSSKREEFSGKLSLLQLSFDKLDGQLKSQTKELEEILAKKSEKEIRIVELKKDLERAENEWQSADFATKKQEQTLDDLNRQLMVKEESIEEILEKIEEQTLEKQTLEARVEELESGLAGKKAEIESLQLEVTQLQVDTASKGQERDGVKTRFEMVSKSLDEVEGQLSQMNEETEKNVQSLSANQILIEESQVQLESMIAQIEEQELSFSRFKDSFEQKSQQTKEIEKEVHEAMRSVNESQAKINDYQLKLEQAKMKEQYMIDQMHERYHVMLDQVADSYQEDDYVQEQVEESLKELKAKIAKIGEVNLSAIEEYQEISQRFEFLNQQLQDLKNAKQQLLRVIERINKICSKRFKETFELVNERFTKVFPVLFGGGEAMLLLKEFEDKDELGIDIISRPPGKKLQNVSLLSGGEKALTAVSLIFSIFLVKPSPFCLLDEVDAPLDDANVFRFNDLVKEMAKRSQIIVVTHNKHTMKVNNKLYGVTMQEKGVSKMVSVNLDEAEQVAL